MCFTKHTLGPKQIRQAGSEAQAHPGLNFFLLDGIQSLVSEMVRDSSKIATSFSASNRVLMYLAKAERLEVSFCCFKKAQDSGSKIDTETYNIQGI